MRFDEIDGEEIRPAPKAKAAKPKPIRAKPVVRFDDLEGEEAVPEAGPSGLPSSSAGGAFVRGVGNVFGTGDLIGAGLQAYGTAASNLPSVLTGKMSLGDFNRDSIRTLQSAHRGNRDQTKADFEQQFWPSLGGRVAAGVAAGPATAANGLRALLATGGGLGAIEGAAQSDSDTIGGRLWDTGKSALYGAGGALLGFGGAKAAPEVFRRLGFGLRGGALDKARKVLTSGADSQSSRLPISDDAARAALDSGSIAPLGTTQGTFERLKRAATNTGEVYNAILEDLEKLGVRGPDAEGLARKMLGKADALRPRTMTEALPAAWEKSADVVRDRARDFTRGGGWRSAEQAAVGGRAELARSQAAKTLSLRQAEELKRSLQKEAKYGRFEETELNKVKKEIASVFRQANEDAITRAGEEMGGEVAEVAGTFVPVKKRLSALLEAKAAATRGNARANQRVGGAAGINTFDLANASQATGSTGLAPLLLAAAQRAWKERGPSALARLYDSSGRGSARLSDLLLRAPSRVFYGAGLGRELGDGAEDWMREPSREDLMLRALLGR